MPDENDDWAALQSGAMQPSAAKPSAPSNLVLILGMWALVALAYGLQIAGLGMISRIAGFASFVLAIVLIVRGNKAAKINGALRLLLAVINLLMLAMQKFH